MKSYILLLGLLLGGFTAYADSTAKKETEAILIGHVVDSRSGEHLPFITITVKGTTIAPPPTSRATTCWATCR